MSPLTPASASEMAEKRDRALVMVRARARVLARLRDGTLDLDAVLAVGHRAIGDPVLGRLRIGRVLEALPRWGAVKVTALLEQLKVDPKTHLDRLSQPVCDAILQAVADRSA